MKINRFILIFIFLLVITPSLLAQGDFGYNSLYDGADLLSNVNYSINVNYSEFSGNAKLFDGYSVSGLYAFFKSQYDNVYCLLTGCTMAGDINMGGNSISNTNNINTITLSASDNVSVGGKVEIADMLFVGIKQEEQTGARNKGDAAFLGNVITNSSFGAFPKQWGFSAAFFNNGANAPDSFILYLNFSGEFNSTSGSFCDNLNKPFLISDKQNVITTLFSSELGTRQIPLIINTFVNSSCVIVDLNIFGNDNAPDLTSISYTISPQPVFAVFDNDLVLNGIRIYYERNDSLPEFGTYTRQNTLQDKPGGTLFADAFTNTNGDIEYVFATQTGINDSGSFLRNSFGVWSTKDYSLSLKQNLTFLHNMEDRWEFINITPSLDYYSAGTGADLAVEHGIETQQLFLHDELGNGELFVEGDANFLLRNTDTDFDIINGPLHVRQPREETIGVDSGELVNRLLATFEQGVLSPFILITTGKGADEWGVISDINCPPNGDFCSHAGPSGGIGDTIMESNITTFNTEDMNITFNINTLDMGSGGALEITIENTTDSTTLYSLIGVDVSDIIINEAIPIQWNNLSQVSIRAYFSSTHPIRGDVWIDSINITGTATASTLENVTRLDTWIKGGSGETTYILYNDSSKQWVFSPNNVSFQSVTQIDLNVTGSIELEGETITNWDNVSLFDENVLLRNGSRSLTGNWAFGSFNITGAGNLGVNNGYFSGNVGIGTISPIDSLQVKESSTHSIISSDGGTSYNSWFYNRINGVLKAAAGYKTTTNAYTIYVNGADRLAINDGGDIVIEDLKGSYTNGEAAVCVYDNGTLFVRDGGCN